MTLDWRLMTVADLAAVVAVADVVHTTHPERPEVFAERLALAADTCFVLTEAGRIVGYAIAHPWAGPPPALDTLVAPLPSVPTELHIHDIALLPAARRRGGAAAIVARLIAQARSARLPRLALVAVNDTAPLWGRLGFQICTEQRAGDALASYGSDAVHMTRTL